MNRLLRGPRLLPLVLFALCSLLVLKAAGLVAGHGYMIGSLQDAQAANWLSGERIGPPPPAGDAKDAEASNGDGDITGSVGGGKPAEPAKPPAGKEPPPVDGTRVPLDDKPPVSAGERALLERLQARRQELDARARDLDMREGLVAAAEKKLAGRIEELKQIEGQIAAATTRKDEAEVARFKGLVMMYENMKPKEAARIFDRLDMSVLLDVATQINPRRMSDILAQMAPEAAERLTVELASRAGGPDKKRGLGDLPKIEGRPRG